ncbi:LptF/LptG family permease [Deinococcus sp. DB0503]|uniref:LptF/LptG family permease n=1 Tax=Deinococcus sp. DB0503 TaxID=2479203 RepID=UPI0018DF0BDB|nr:LptF/LptG family permease [Deinococcus sp. DB0503]MBI0446339.1 YjgP/YjgQ family permease [Deinococcus sp. DB0503]
MPRVPFTLTRYVLREVLRWYAAGLALFLILQLTDALSTTVGVLLLYHATPAEALAVFGAIAPDKFNRSLVLAVPFAILLTFGRLQGDSELKAMFAAGVPPLRLVWPLAVPFVLVGVLAFVNAGYVVPSGLARWDRAWYTIYGTVPPPPSQDNYTFAPPGALFYAGRVRNGAESGVAQLDGVLIERGGETVTAQSGTWDTQAHTWTVRDAWITRPGADPRQVTGPLVFSQTDTLRPPQPPAEQVSTPALRARLAADDYTTPEKRRVDEHQLAARYADPVTPIVFALVAGVLGLLLRNRAAAFAATLVVILVFYVLWTTAPQLARVGALPPTLAAWLPNLAFLLVAAGLAWRLR